MGKGTPVTAQDLNIFLERIRAGDTQTQAANAAGQANAAPFTRRKDHRSAIYDPVFTQAFNEAVEDQLQRKRDGADELVETRAFKPEATTADVKLYAQRWHPLYRERYVEESRGGDDDRSDHIAEAIERFTAAVVQLASRERPELPPGETP